MEDITTLELPEACEAAYPVRVHVKSGCKYEVYYGKGMSNRHFAVHLLSPTQLPQHPRQFTIHLNNTAATTPTPLYCASPLQHSYHNTHTNLLYILTTQLLQHPHQFTIHLTNTAATTPTPIYYTS